VRQRAPSRHDGDVGVGEQVLSGAQLYAADVSEWASKLYDVFLVEPVQTEVVIEEKAGGVAEDFLHSATLKLNGFRRVIIGPRFTDKEWLTDAYGAELLIISQRARDLA